MIGRSLAAVLLAGTLAAPGVAAAAVSGAMASGSGAGPSKAGEHAVLADANAALQSGEADKALSLIQSLPGGGIDNAEAENLTCRVQFTMGQWDPAIRACQRAIELDPRYSGNHLWMGRALGEKADKASFVNAFTLSKRVLAEFQLAAQLDPRNGEALSDLGEFYLEAPGLVGGGLQKAESVAEELDRVDPVRAAELRAGIARQRGDYGQAEDDLNKALAISRHPARQWATLARFYAARGRWSNMEDAVRNCAAAESRDPHAAVALYDAAGVLIKVKRDPEMAIKLLQDYLASPDKTEEAPAFVACVRLARLRQQQGDAANAQVAMSEAYELAHEYRPLQDLRR